MADLRAVAAELDASLPETVLVYGSLPDDASDLDLLVRPRAQDALRTLLPEHGFAPWHGGWMRVRGATTAVVDLEPAQGWGLPDDELAALYADASPLPGLQRVCAPAPHHALLVLARLLLLSGGRTSHRRLARARRALLADPDAFARAEPSAAAWGCSGALEVLRARLEGRPLTRAEVDRLLARDGGRTDPAWRRSARAVRAGRPPRGVVVSVSGLDGAGKSTQTAAVVDALDSLGYETVLLWDRISHNRMLLRLAAPAKLARRLLRPTTPPAAPAPAATAVPPPAGLATAQELPERTTAAMAVWSLVVTVVHVLAAAPMTRRHVRLGRVVVRDRYVLDSVVHLGYRYGDRSRFAVHTALLRAALPRPAAAYFLDIAAEEAHRRKPEEYDVAHLRRQRALYLAHAGRQGVQVLDGTTPREQLAERIVREVVDVLQARGVRTT